MNDDDEDGDEYKDEDADTALVSWLAGGRIANRRWCRMQMAALQAGSNIAQLAAGVVAGR